MPHRAQTTTTPPPPAATAAHDSPQPSTFDDGAPLPQLLVFDLDYTLWPFWVDTHVSSPLKAQPGGRTVKDRWGEDYGFYDDVGGVLVSAREKGMQIAAASRTHTPELAREMLALLKVKDTKAIELFDFMQIYPGSKIKHFRKLHDLTGVDYKEMLFFDDESRNREVESLGVVMQLVRDGVTKDEVDKAVRSWRKKNKRESQ